MKKFFGEFRKFINKGNVIDLAVAVIIGAAFGKIVSSLVDDIITPLTSLVIGGVDFVDLKFVIIEAKESVAEVAIYYGRFLKNILDFVIVAFSIFLVVKFYNSARTNLQKQIAEGGTKIRGFFENKDDGKNKNADGENGNNVTETDAKDGENGNNIAEADAKDGENGNDITETDAKDGENKTAAVEAKNSDGLQKSENKEEKQGEDVNLLKEIRDLLTARLGKK
jgi:large conductance mechanosensitive channel